MILITGLGAISAAGINLADTLTSFERGNRNAGPVSLFETKLKYPVFEVKEIPEKFHLEGQRTLSLALAAVFEAMEDARLEGDLSGRRIGVCMGTTVASQLNDLDFYTSYRSSGAAPMAAVDRYLKGNLAESILRKLKAKGPAFTIVNACSSGTDAIGVAMSWLNSDLCDIAIAGGADELCRIPLCGFASLGIMNPDLCAPFDKDRKGLSLGEGAGILVMETEDSAQKRGIGSNLCLMGYGSAADAYHLTAPHPQGVGLHAAINKALAYSGIKPEDVSFINAHGTGTIDNDMVEGNVLKRIFGADIKMLSTKGFTGHTLGAAGGVEAAFTAAALKYGWIPASIGFKNRDEAIPISPITEKTSVNGRYAVSTSLAFGGNNAAIVLGRDLKT